MRPRERRLLIAAHGADDRRPEILRPLAGDEADPARGGMEQDGLTGLHGIRPAQQVLDGHALQHHRRGLARVDPGGDLHDLPGRHQALLRVGADRGRGIGDPIPRRRRVDTLPDRFDDPGALHPRRKRERRRGIEPGAEVDVDVVEPYRFVPDPDLAGSGRADLDVFPPHRIGAAGAMDPDCLGHECPPLVPRPDWSFDRALFSAGRSAGPAADAAQAVMGRHERSRILPVKHRSVVNGAPASG